MKAERFPLVAILVTAATLKAIVLTADTQPVELFLALNRNLYMPGVFDLGKGIFISPFVPEIVPALTATKELIAGEPTVIEYWSGDPVALLIG